MSDISDAVITSPANPRLKALVALRRRRTRDEQGLTLVDGYEELELALAAGVRLRALYYCPELMLGQGTSDRTGGLASGPRSDSQREQELLVRRVASSGVPITRLSRTAFEKVAYREGPDGFLAVVPSPTNTVESLTLPADPLVLLCQGVEKPGNLGAMLRTADAAGVSAVVAADPVTDWGNPNLVRASKGTVFSVPIATSSTAEGLEWLERAGIALVATTPDSDLDYTAVDYTGPVAIAVGTEKAGLTGDILDAATYRVRIPMAGRANSLNVATSAAIVVYEAVRQRRATSGG